MEKRLLLAFLLSFVVLAGWQMCHPPPPRPDVVPGAADGARLPESEPTAVEVERPDPIGDVVSAESEEELDVVFGAPGEPGYYHARFRNRGGALAELSVGSYFDVVGLSEEERADPAHWMPLLQSVDDGRGGTASLLLHTRASSAPLVIEPLEQALWVMRPLGGDAKNGVEFELAPGTGVVFKKRIEPVPGRYELAVTLSIENEAAEGFGDVQFGFLPASVMAAEQDGRFYPEPTAIAAGPLGAEEIDVDSETASEGASDLTGPLNAPVPLSFAGIHNKYFAALLRADDDAARRSLQGARYRRVADATWAEQEHVPLDRALRYVTSEVDLALQLPPRGESRSWSYTLYAGPKKRDVLEASFADHTALIESDLGFFSGIGSMLLAVMGFFQSVVGNWGVSIILLTLLVRSVLFPLNRRSQTSMARHAKKMKRIQPLLDEVKKKHEKDAQKMRQEQARIMQENGAFPPLGGCLPLFLQMPVFFGLFSALRTSFDLRQAPFALWVEDLSQPDRLAKINLDLFFFELEYLNLLPILMVILWIWQQRTMPTPSDEQAQRMQKMMMFVSTAMGFFLYNYASGLSLYMITQSSLGIFEQKVIKKVWPVDDTEVESKKKRGCGPFTGMMERIAEQQKAQMKRLQEQERQRAAQKKKGKRAKR